MKIKMFVTVMGLLFMGTLFLIPAAQAGVVDPSLEKVLTKEWRYYTGFFEKEGGSVIFDNTTSGTISDIKWGEGSFTGKFTNKDTFEGTANFDKNPKLKGQKLTVIFKFKKKFDAWQFQGEVKGKKTSFRMKDGEITSF